MLSSLRIAQPILQRSICRSQVASSKIAFPLQRSFASSSIVQKVSIRYTAEHEWVKFDDANATGTIGITDYAQKSLGDVVYVELPSEGSEVQQGGE